MRLAGVREGVKGLVKTQAGADADMHSLARTDPEDGIAALQQRLTEAERFTQVQQSRNEASDLQSRVDYLRGQQQALKERLVPVLEKRRSIEQLFMELEGHQNDIDRTLNEIASGDAAIALDVGLKDMMEFVRRSNSRCDDIEAAAKLMAGLREDYAELRQPARSLRGGGGRRGQPDQGAARGARPADGGYRISAADARRSARRTGTEIRERQESARRPLVRPE